MKKVIVFEPDYNDEHCEVLRAFAEGIPGAIVRPVTEYEPCDVAVIFGGVKRVFEPTWSKQAVLDNHSGRNLIMVESAFIRRGEYYQIGFGGAAGHADFRLNGDESLDRFFDLETPYKNWKKKNEERPIVVCGQLPRDVQVQDVDHCKWCRDTVNYYNSRGLYVIFRPHPKIDDFNVYGVERRFVNLDPLEITLNRARCFVTYNSTSVVDAVVNGVPAIAVDRGSIGYEFVSNDLDNLDYTFDRKQFFAGIGYSQWTLAEMRAGKPWEWFTRIID